jgi:hypothetical protein
MLKVANAVVHPLRGASSQKTHDGGNMSKIGYRTSVAVCALVVASTFNVPAWQKTIQLTMKASCN